MSIRCITHGSKDVIEIPDFGEDGPIIHASKVRDRSDLGFYDNLKIVQHILRLVWGDNAAASVMWQNELHVSTGGGIDTHAARRL